MRLYLRLLSLVLVMGVVISGCTILGNKDRNKLKSESVQDLKVEDIPFDGGDGLMISWKPLPKEKRVMEYRIYRGVHPDTLFFLQAVQVNVKTGVASDQMSYYDTGYTQFIDITSPGKLKYEQQNKDSILYRRIPRDIELAASLGSRYNLYTQVDAGDYYKHTVKSKSADPEDETVYAGLGLFRQSIYAALKKNETYYYTVVPVNERNVFMGIADPKSATPRDNPPEPAAGFYSTILEDQKKLNFEWDYPLNKSDIMAYSIYLVPNASDSVWAEAKDSLLAAPAQAVETNANGRMVTRQYKSAPSFPGLRAYYLGDKTTSAPANRGNFKNYVSLDSKDLEQGGFSWEELTQARYAIELQDRVGKSISMLATPRLKSSADLPLKLEYEVEDKINDKGDRLSVLWENPIVFITKTTSLNKENTSLKINYQLNKTETQKVNNLYFEFFTTEADTPFLKLNEFYQDNILKLKLPKGYDYKQGLKVKMTMRVSPYKINPTNGRLSFEKPRMLTDYALEQNLNWDPSMLALMPSTELYRNGKEISELRNVVYTKYYSDDNFYLVKRNTSYDNNLDVTIPYSATEGLGIMGFNYVKGDSLYTVTLPAGKRFARKLEPGDKAKDMVLVNSELDFTYDVENGTQLYTSLYLDEARKTIKDLEAEIDKTKKELSGKQQELEGLKADPGSVIAAAGRIAELEREVSNLPSQVESLSEQLEVYKSNAKFSRMLKFSSNRARLAYVASVRNKESRSRNYMVVRTDGKGLFTESELDKNDAGEFNYYFPASNWFDWNKLVTLIAVLLFGGTVVVFVNLAKRGKDLYIRPIAGLHEIENAVGRATEMGRPMLYCMGHGTLSDVATLASMGILGLVARKAAEYDTKIIVPCYDYIVMPIAQEIVREAHYAVGRPDSFDKNNIFYLTNAQFPYVAGVNGIMIRERVATNFFMGYFSAEALLMTETGNAVGAVQIAGSDAITQIPFFITTCDYTLIGEELYAASAYLNKEPMLLGTLKAQDYFKFLIFFFLILGAVLASFQATGILDIFPIK